MLGASRDSLLKRALPAALRGVVVGDGLCAAATELITIRWQGPEGGEALLQIVRSAYFVPEHKLVYLRNAATGEILDVDLPLSEDTQFEVRVEPEETGDFNIVPCMVNMCMFSYAGCTDRQETPSRA
jgi:hypothetical protein